MSLRFYWPVINKVRFIWWWKTRRTTFINGSCKFLYHTTFGYLLPNFWVQIPESWYKNLRDPLIKVVLLDHHYHINLTLLIQLWFRFDLGLFKKWSFYKDPLFTEIFPFCNCTVLFPNWVRLSFRWPPSIDFQFSGNSFTYEHKQ